MEEMTGNRTLGNSFEQRLAKKLASYGFWVHLLTQNQAGQPADIIAAKDNIAILIDAKVCSNGRFDTNRIEANQLGSMKVWSEKGNHEWWFALEMPDESVYMIPGEYAVRWELDNTSPSIYWRDLKDRFLTLERWVERFEDLYRL